MPFVYRATCSVTGKSYIGLTTRTVERRWRWHVEAAKARAVPGSLFHKAIRAYGAPAFSLVTCAEVPTLADAAEIERMMIAAESLYPLGYNLAPGGIGGPTMTGRTQSRETVERRSATMRGRKLSAAHCAAIGNARRGKKLRISETRRAQIIAIGRANKGKKHTQTFRLMSQIIRHQKSIAKAARGAPVGIGQQKGYWRAKISIDGKPRHLGMFPTREAAQAARNEAAQAHLTHLLSLLGL